MTPELSKAAFMAPRPVFVLDPRACGKMVRAASFALAALALAGCASNPPKLDANGAAVDGAYLVTEKNLPMVRARAADALNAERLRAGVAPVALDPALTLAADRHSRSMAAQRRPWSFGEDGSTPMDRAKAAGFDGTVLGEVVSETYETEVQTIDVWMQDRHKRAVLQDPAARRVGLGVYQQESHKLWWTLTTAN